MNQESGNNRPEYYDEYEIDLREYIMLLWNHKFFIGGIVILAVIAAFVVSSFVLSPQYESEANIIAPEFQLLNDSVISNEDYIAVLTGDTVMEEILDIINQSRDEENKIKKQGLLDRLNYNISENTDQINFTFSFNDPEKAQSNLNQWLNIFTDRVEEYVANQNTNYYESIDNKANNDYKNYQSALDKLTNFKSSNNLDLLKRNLSSKERKVIDLNSDIMDLKNTLEAEKKELEYITSRLDDTEQYLVRKNLISDEFLQKLQTVNSESALINLLNTEEEFLNPEFENLINREINISTRLASKQNNLENYIEDREKLNSEILNLQERISILSQEKTILEDELSNSEKAYNLSNDKIRSLDQTLVEREYNLTVLSSPNLPENPVSPNTKLNLAIAAVLGLMLAVFIVFFKEFMKEE